MKISIIIPTFRPGKYLIECVDSIEKQTLPKFIFEVIIVLNGDKDPFQKLIKKIIENSKISIKLIYTQIKGVSNARNVALDYIKSEYVVFIDDDDLISKNYLEALFNKATEDNIVVSNVKTFIKDTNKLGNDYITNSYNKFKSNSKYNVLRYRSFLSSACCKIIPVKIIAENRFNKRFSVGEDSLFMFAITNKLTLIELANKSAIYYRRLRKGSASRKKNKLIINIYFLLMSIYEYTRLYLSDLRGYNFALYLSRLMAVKISFYNRTIKN
jgi:glycosyltransferase involved in cell wall biosynthesis